MQTIYTEIKEYLEREPRARERHSRDRAMVNILLTRYKLNEITKDKLIDFCHDFESYCRVWRKVLEENESLRGKDYNTKQEVEERKMLSLGYVPGFEQTMKQLDLLTLKK